MIVLLACLILSSPSYATEVEDQIHALQSNPSYDATYFYNLAVLYEKTGNIEQALANALKADRLKRHDRENQLLLHYVKNEWSKKYHEKPEIAATDLEILSDRISEDELTGVIALTNFVVALLWARSYLRTRNLRRAVLNPSGWLGALALVVEFFLLGVYRIGVANPPAVLVSGFALRSGPGDNFDKLRSLPVGSIIRRTGTPTTVGSGPSSETWQEVRISKQESAWIPSSCLLPL